MKLLILLRGSSLIIISGTWFSVIIWRSWMRWRRLLTSGSWCWALSLRLTS